MNGVDAQVELVRELDRLSETDTIARDAPRNKAIYNYLNLGIKSPEGEQYLAVTTELLVRLGVWWSTAAYSRMPVMTPWCVRDRTCRYDQGPEAWGSPRSDGYMRDDNSIIKKLPLSVQIVAPTGHPLNNRRPWRGFTACHIWRELPGGTVAGIDPWLYSFMPNLVWLPTWLAPLSDRHGSPVQEILQRTSIQIFRDRVVSPSLEKITRRAWEILPSPPEGPALQTDRLAFFEPDEKFFNRRIAYLDRVVAGCTSVMTAGTLKSKLICSRYTAGLPLLEAAALSGFRDAMSSYRTALTEANCQRS